MAINRDNMDEKKIETENETKTENETGTETNTLSDDMGVDGEDKDIY